MPRGKQILVVDDMPDSQAFLSAAVEDAGYQVRVADDGKQALEAINKEKPDLILLDIMMPGQSGLAVYSEVKKDPRFSDIPIVFVTGASRETGIDITTGKDRPREDLSLLESYARGLGQRIHEGLSSIEPDGLIQKPVDTQLLVAKIEELLSKR